MFRRLTRPASGLSSRYMWQLYLAVAVPKMTYGLDTWYTPPNKELGKKRNSGSVGALKEFTKLQRIAILAINGALRSSPTDLLDAHAGLLPMDLLLWKICFRALARISTLLATNPVSKQVNHHHQHPAKTYLKNIQHLLRIFSFNPKVVEKITPLTCHVNEQLPFITNIPDSKDEAIRQESSDSSPIRIYTNGLNVGGNVGAAAIMYRSRNHPAKSLCYKLGTSSE